MKKEKNNKKVYMADSFVNVPDLKCSFFILQDKSDIDDETIVIKLEDGRYKNIIVGIKNFKFESENSSLLTFDYEVIHNPYDKIANPNNFEMIVKNVVKKIITYAIKSAEEISKKAAETAALEKNKTVRKGK